MSDIILDPNQPADFAGGMSPAPQGAAQGTAPADLIKDSDTNNFVADVIDASQSVPVLVDFWSPRSDACKKFIPMLERLVKRAGGLVKLVKINVDAAPELAQQLRVQSVPTVFAFKDGRPVDAVAGVQGDAQLQSFIDKLIGDAKPPIEAAMDQAAELLAAGEAAQAEDVYTSILGQDEAYTPALAGMIRAIAALGEFDRATDIIDSLDTKTRNLPDITQAVSALELAQQSAGVDASGTQALEAMVAAEPKNLQARFDLAQALFASGRTEDAIDHLLDIVRLDREWNDAAGRKQLIKIFDTLGNADPLTVDARKRLSAVLFS